MGLGNPLMGDDGFGVRVVELLGAGYRFPENVEVMDAGTMGYMLLDAWRGVDHVIVVDAMRGTGHPVGTVLGPMSPDEFEHQIQHTGHDVRLVNVVQAAELMGLTPNIVAFGVEVTAFEDKDWVLELSEPTEAAVPVAAGAVLQELESLGIETVSCGDSDTHARILEALRTHAPMPDQGPAAS